MGSYQNGIDIQKLRSKVDSLKREICCLKTDFCQRVDDCLGISPSGQSDLFLNQQGDWVSAGGGGTCCDVIEVTIAQMQTLISNGTVEFPATYRITNVGDLGGIFTSTSTSSINPQGTAVLLVPDYTVTGSYMGQLLPSSTVNIGEIWIWGTHYWVNITGVNSAALDDLNLDPTDWNQISKSVANNYTPIQFLVQLDITTGALTNVTQISEQNSNNQAALFLALYSYDATAFQWNNSGIVVVENSVPILNNIVEPSPLSFILGNCSATHQGIFPIKENSLVNGSSISGNNILTQSFIQGNTLDNGSIGSNILRGGEIIGNTLTGGVLGTNTVYNSFISNNTITGTGNIGYNYLNDNSSINNNTLTGTNAFIWDIMTGENCEVNGNTITHTAGGGGLDSALISDIHQIQFDKVNDNVLNSDDVKIEAVFQSGYCQIINNNLAELGARISEINMRNSIIDGFTITNGSGKVGITRTDLYDATISNGTDFNISNCYFSNINIDFSLWSRDIENETIEAGTGVFTFIHDFTTNPVTAGNSVYYGFIPDGAVGTRITLIPDSLTGGIGATLEVGIETDDTDYGIAPTVLGSVGNTTVVTLSNATTGQRSIALTAGVADITGGTLKVTFEFIV